MVTLIRKRGSEQMNDTKRYGFGNFLLAILITIIICGVILISSVVVAKASGKEQEFFEALGIDNFVSQEEKDEVGL